MTIKKVLDDREKRYGQYQVVSKISQELKYIMQYSPNSS